MSLAIQVDNVSKVYRLGKLTRGLFLRDWKRKLTGDLSEISEAEEAKLFWALSDVSFGVEEGEVLGLLGRNGAGKSTMLKLVAQITAPTHGHVRLRGRVASLLEVGTGFHPDLSGRDNVFLNGNILGMSQREVRAKFDEIVAFSGVEEFIDTPVKRYSVGMRIRLAFAVAAHLEPEILLVDEVLAVGDAVFQKKCLGKIGEVSRSGRTVLFVSHNSGTIEALCTRGVVLDHGRLVFDGTAREAIEHHAAARAALAHQLHEETNHGGTGAVRVTALHFRAGLAGQGAARAGEPLEFVLDFEQRTPGDYERLSAQITVSTYLGVPIFTHASYLSGTAFGKLPERGTFVCHLPRLPLPPGRYQVGLKLWGEMMRNTLLLDHVETAAELVVEGGAFYASGRLPGLREGVSLVDGSWSVQAR